MPCGAGGSTANKWPVAIAILDATGSLIMQNLDNTHTRSAEIVIGKAHTALDFRRPSKAMAPVSACFRCAILALAGRVPAMVDGKVVGAVGVSGVTSEQDA
jgi:glc operon protein GlcG